MRSPYYIAVKPKGCWSILVHGVPLLECESFEKALEAATTAARLAGRFRDAALAASQIERFRTWRKTEIRKPRYMLRNWKPYVGTQVRSFTSR